VGYNKRSFQSKNATQLKLLLKLSKNPLPKKTMKKSPTSGSKMTKIMLDGTKNRAIFNGFLPLCTGHLLIRDFFDSLVSRQRFNY
jgi:hypothetical protein